MKNTKILFLYILLGFFWMVVTDYIVEQYASIEWIMTFQRIKGVIYVLLTTCFFYFVLKKIEELNDTKEQEQKLSTLINSMVDFVNFKDGEGRWLEINDFGLKLFQLENVDYRGKTDSELAEYTSFYKEALIYCENSDEIAWQNGKITRCEEVIPMPNGTSKFFDTIKVPLFHEDGSRKGLVVIGRDITDRVQAEEQLRKREKLSIVGELAASVGHEIRNPLTSIKGFLQLLQKKENNNKTYYDLMLNELERIDHIVGELLMLAKPQKIHFSTFDVKEILKDVVSLLQTQANMNNIILYYDFDVNEEFFIKCEKNMLKQLFINLVKNAIEASSDKGKVWINLKKKPEKIIITVEDEGTGIPEHFLKRLGEPFYSSKEKGTGLGLTVSHKIVEQHKGNIHFQSREGVGTKVEVELPVN
ncbi:ATP-binding protein [Anaerobacillus sp. MEB173]|uniref:ATP-binding protein n=1 Tax=Anaerobacillus sp. MEB173 TaxID=3383345 RepID=UPI003F8FD6A4